MKEENRMYTTSVDMDGLCRRELFRQALCKGAEDYLQEKMSHANMIELLGKLMKKVAGALNGYSRGLALRALHETEELIMHNLHENTCAEIESYWYEADSDKGG